MNRLLLPAPATKQEPPTEETAPELDKRYDAKASSEMPCSALPDS